MIKIAGAKKIKSTTNTAYNYSVPLNITCAHFDLMWNSNRLIFLE